MEGSGSIVRVLVLGGSGFIGSHLVDRLLQAGHQVALLDLAPSRYAKDIPSFIGSHEDPELLRAATRNQDVVCHLISTTVPATSNQDIEFDIRSNLTATIRLLDIMRENQVNRLVYLSSGGAVYGNPQAYPIDETHPLHPISSYGIVKVAIERYLFMYQELYGLQPVVIRPSNAYGPRQNFVKPQGVIAHFLASALQGEALSIWGRGDVRRDYVYIGDLVDLIGRTVESTQVGTFNAGAGCDTSILEIVDVLEKLLGRSLEKRFLEPRSYDVQKVRLDVAAAERTFGWQPTTSLEAGVRLQLESLEGEFK